MKVDAILCADVHMRHDTPKCRTDDYQHAQWTKWQEILELGVHYDAPILVAGDLGHKYQWPSPLLREFIFRWSAAGQPEIILVPGQHDLPYHKVDNWDQSAIGVLEAAGCITVLLGSSRLPMSMAGDIMLYDFPWGVGMDRRIQGTECTAIAMTHQLVMEGKGNKADWPGADAAFALELLKAHPQFQLILSGDNHKPFVVEHDGRLLVNPGSVMRMTADQADHRPRVYLWNRQNEYEEYYLAAPADVITRDYLDEQQAKKHRMEAFVASVADGPAKGLSFEDNVRRLMDERQVHKNVQDKVWECIDEPEEQ